MKRIYNSLRLLLVLLLGMQASGSAQTVVFSFLAAPQYYTVPAGVTRITVIAKGAQGGINADGSDRQGYGAIVTAVVDVVPGQVLQINTGGCGGPGTVSAGGAGGYNGGGNGSFGISGLAGGGGGGYTDVRAEPYDDASIVVLAGGGGGAGASCGGNFERGGDAGPRIFPFVGADSSEDGKACGSGSTGGGGGNWLPTTSSGTPGVGGTCSCLGSPGTPGAPFDGGNGGSSSAGGGGGGGYFGGGGGQWSGGGGGSDYYSAFGVYVQNEQRGWRSCGTVTITPYCKPGAIVGPDSVCSGSTITLTDATGAGCITWSTASGYSGGPYYTSVVSSTCTSAIISGSNSTDTVIATFTPATISPYSPGCIVKFPVTVNPVPNIITYPGYPAPAAICVGQTLALTTTSTGGTWSSSSPAVATVGTNGLVTGITAGVVTIAYTFPTGCSAVVSVTINPLPDIPGGADSMCLGAGTTLSAAAPGIYWVESPPAGIVTITPSGVPSSVGTLLGIVAGQTVVCDSFGTTGCKSCVNVTVNPVPATPSPVTGCQGVAMTEISSPGPGVWSGGSITFGTIDPVTGSITPLLTGTTTITYTTSHGCSRSSILTVNPNPPPMAGVSSVCSGQCITMTETSTGTWSVAPSSIGSVSPTSGTTTSFCGTFPGAAGTISVGSVVFTYATGCKTTKIVTVNAQPHPITGPNPICTGNCGTLTTGDAGGVWSPSTGLIGTIDAATGVFCAVTTSTVSSTVTVRYTYTVTPGCYSQTTINVNPSPVLYGPDSVCKGGTVLLCALPTGGTWTQSRPPSTITTITPGGAGCINVFGESAGMDTLSYARLGCTAVAVFTVNPVVIGIGGTKTDLCQGDTATVFVTSPAGGTWTSDNPGLATVDPVTGLVTTVPPDVSGGIVHFTYTTPGGCSDTYTMNIHGKPGNIPPPHAVCLSAGLVTIPLPSGGAGVWSLTNPAIGTIDSILGNFTPFTEDTTHICFTLRPSGCFRCDTLRVLPAPSSISGPSSVCEGFSITLTDPDGTSTWSVTNASGTIGAGTGIFVGDTVGVDTVRFTNGGGCYATKTVTVHASPQPITGTTSICQGQTTVLRDATGGGSWSIAPTSVATLSPTFGGSTTVRGISAGTATVDYTQGFFGCYAQVTVTVTNGVPPITGPGTLCQGSSATFSDFGAPGTGTWTSSNTTVATTGTAAGLSTLVIADAAGGPTGVTTITFQSSTGCTATKDLTVNLTPAALITPIGRTDLCPGDNAVLTSTTGVGFTYQWKKGGIPIAGVTNSTYITNIPGSYTVTITVGSCSATSNPVVVTMNPVIAGVTPTSMVVCASASASLNATPTGAGYTYQWISGTGAIPGATAASFVPTVNGTYSVKVTNAFGCASTSPTASVTLRTSPVVTVSPGTATICAGASVTLIGSATAGVTYQWNLGGTPIPGATTNTYVAFVAGSYTLTESNGTCATTSASIPVGVITAPAAVITVAGDTTVCAGGTGPNTVILTASPTGAYTYQWYRGGVAIPGAVGVNYVASVTGSYTVRVTTTASGCSGTSRAQGVNVIPVPTVSPLSATSFCWGGSVRLSVSASTVPGVSITYFWYKNGVAIPGASGPSYTATTSGLYSVSVSFTSIVGVCSMTTRTVSVTMYPLPNPVVTFDGTYFHTGSFVTYQWYKNTIAIAGATTSAVHHLGVGSYSVRVTDVNGCQSVSPAYVLTYIPPAPPSGSRDVDEVKMINDAGNIKIYPNPAQNMVHIEAAMEVHAVIAGIDGRTVIDQSAAKDISLDNIPDGVYIIKLFNTDGVLVRTDKLVKAGGR